VRGQFDSDRLFTLGPIALAGTFEPDVSASTLTAGQSALLFANSGPDPVSGAFDSHPEGTYIPVGGSLALRMTYVMGTGNDIGVVAEDVTGAPPATPPRGLLAILAARPNPATDLQTFLIEIPASTLGAKLEIFDLSGRRIWRAPDGAVAAGLQEIDWDGRDDGGRIVGAGVYLVRLVGDGLAASTRRLARVR
jgi:hypothetical protein